MQGSPDVREFRLAIDEVEFLSRLSNEENAALAPLLNSLKKYGPWTFCARLKEDQIEPLRDSLTTLLAEIGFDEDYKLTSAGSILEDLIDRFSINDR